MIQNRRQQVKETALTLNAGNKSTGRIFSHRKTPSQNLLQKKPQILLMKWNDFLQKFHMLKQLHTINNSFNTVNTHLKVKKQQLTIFDVPYIQSEQVSINQRDQEPQIIMQQSRVVDKLNVVQSNVSKNIQGTSRTKSSMKINNEDQVEQAKQVQSQNKNKIVISVQISQESESNMNKKSRQRDYQNFTDDEQNQDENSNTKSENDKKHVINRKLNFTQSSSKQQQQQIIQSHYINESLRDTAHFSFNGDHLKSKSPQLKYSNKDNQQNVNHLNNCQFSRKVKVLMKLQNEQQVRREKAQKIMKQDQEYLSKFLKKK